MSCKNYISNHNYEKTKQSFSFIVYIYQNKTAKPVRLFIYLFPCFALY